MLQSQRGVTAAVLLVKLTGDPLGKAMHAADASF